MLYVVVNELIVMDKKNKSVVFALWIYSTIPVLCRCTRCIYTWQMRMSITKKCTRWRQSWASVEDSESCWKGTLRIAALWYVLERIFMPNFVSFIFILICK